MADAILVAASGTAQVAARNLNKKGTNMTGELTQTNGALGFLTSAMQMARADESKGKNQPSTAYARKCSARIERFTQNINRLEQSAPRPRGALRNQWLAWKVEFSAARVVSTVLRAPSREIALGLLNVCRSNIAQVPETMLRDSLYIATDLAAARIENRFIAAA